MDLNGASLKFQGKGVVCFSLRRW